MDPNTSILSAQAAPQAAEGTLVIIVCRAKHLPNRRKLDKQSPYVTLRLGTTAKKTPSHFRAGQTPDWTHEIRFDLTRERKPILKLDVLDETKNDPTPIGTCDIDCSVIFQQEKHQDGKYIHDMWYDLSLNGRRAGTIYLEMTFYPSAPVLPPKLYENGDYETSHMRGSGSSYSSGYGSAKDLPAPPRHPSQSRQPSVVDDIFVSADAKKKSLFRNLVGDVPDTSNGAEDDDVFVTPGTSPEKKSRFAKLTKLKSKFQSKDPIRTLWSAEERERHERGDRVTPIDIKEFDNLDELERDIQFNSPRSPQFAATADDSFDVPPSPPPHSEYSPVQPHSHTPSPHQTPPLKTSPLRKPPPETGVKAFKNLNLGSPATTSIPYSADTIGLDDEDGGLPTKVYFMDKQVKSLSHSSSPSAPEPVNKHEIDPKFYAPTPGEHFSRSRREEDKRTMDLRTRETGYLGDGQWDQKFSPSIFDRIPNDENLGFENKPHVPPKIPRGLTEQEYYVLDKENYLRDINGKRA
ncbi:hypothetical protein PSN45_005128 [Yamadazyma tenuis]|uniref:C2 domain-containing protein n=1 Tax=Candida tenuis (strain ATCC 10573 / BCRC 21748 / CBS 615 / JCM 9827 / NBRC 10315 / NRRL Y-1498 / VKM Y-70) TaxID=590646 RepID=G3B2W6_CANTC|nr:uncharacterized protein CANTEDRAFT_93017 [Yamadazyma tenuis ATCC 10573]EGV64780.1 hypothetical protein CANTEDRAFT_93017 [Yamadazyma tenuis ATCC 10573]WEJ97572.1 hypothetical protein PSN45_005128 [Yamadazyma tenuis]